MIGASSDTGAPAEGPAGEIDHDTSAADATVAQTQSIATTRDRRRMGDSIV